MSLMNVVRKKLEEGKDEDDVQMDVDDDEA